MKIMAIPSAAYLVRNQSEAFCSSGPIWLVKCPNVNGFFAEWQKKGNPCLGLTLTETQALHNCSGGIFLERHRFDLFLGPVRPFQACSIFSSLLLTDGRGISSDSRWVHFLSILMQRNFGHEKKRPRCCPFNSTKKPLGWQSYWHHANIMASFVQNQCQSFFFLYSAGRFT